MVADNRIRAKDVAAVLSTNTTITSIDLGGEMCEQGECGVRFGTQHCVDYINFETSREVFEVSIIVVTL